MLITRNPYPQPNIPAHRPGSLHNNTFQESPKDSYQAVSEEPLGYVARPLTMGVATLSTVTIPFASAVAADRLLGAAAGPLGMAVGLGLAAVAIPTVFSALATADSNHFEKTGKQGTFFKPYYHPDETVVRF